MDLAVVSTYAPGMRLSEALKKPRGAAFAMRMLRQLMPALAALQQHGARHRPRCCWTSIGSSSPPRVS